MRVGSSRKPWEQASECPVKAPILLQTQEGKGELVTREAMDIPSFDSQDLIHVEWVPQGQTVKKEY